MKIILSLLTIVAAHGANMRETPKMSSDTLEGNNSSPNSNTEELIRINNTISDIRCPVGSDRNCKTDIQWIFHRLFETIVETKVRFLILTNNSYFFKVIT